MCYFSFTFYPLAIQRHLQNADLTMSAPCLDFFSFPLPPTMTLNLVGRGLGRREWCPFQNHRRKEARFKASDIIWKEKLKHLAHKYSSCLVVIYRQYCNSQPFWESILFWVCRGVHGILIFIKGSHRFCCCCLRNTGVRGEIMPPLSCIKFSNTDGLVSGLSVFYWSRFLCQSNFISVIMTW